MPACRGGQAGEVEITQAGDTALEGLLVGLLARQQFDPRIEKTPQPTAFYVQFEHQGFPPCSTQSALSRPACKRAATGRVCSPKS